MLTLEIIRVSLTAIRSNKLRSFLTMLGVIIGIAAVITMVALGEGAKRAVEEQIQALGSDVLSVRPGQAWFHGVRSADARLTVDDAEAIRREAPSIASMAPEMRANLQVEFSRSNANLRVIGTTPTFPTVNHYELDVGHFFDSREDRGRRRVAVLGGAVPKVLAVTPLQIVGQQISIRSVTFRVVGVLKEKGGSGFYNSDEQVYIPLQTAMFRVMGTDRIGQINVAVADGTPMATAMMQIEEALRRRHRLRPGTENDFWIQDRAELLGTRQEATQTFTFLLAAIAAVSLLVGGIGIMNIMLVSVTERTREIGVRKALGATRRAVLMQFLFEAVVLCSAGGVLGIALGIGGAAALAAAANWNTVVSLQAVLLAIVFSISVGLFFGIWPARRAAAMDPIVALRYE